MAKRGKRIQAEDLYRLRIIGDLDVSPGGDGVVYALQRVDRRTEKKHTNLYIVPTEGGDPRQFTYGDQADVHPRFSPDGRKIAFLSNRADEKQPQVYVIPIDGGEARKVTDLKGAILSFSWSPDGKRLALAFRKKDADVLEREKDPEKKKLGAVERHYDRVFYKLDGFGYLPKERLHIWTVDVSTGKARQLTDSKVHDEADPVFSPDATLIAFVSNRADDPDFDPGQVDIWALPANGGRMKKIPTPPGPKGSLAFSPDGEFIAYLGVDGKNVGWKNTELWIVGADGRRRARSLTGHTDFNVSNGTINDMVEQGARPVWSPDASEIYFPVQRHGNALLKKVSIREERPMLVDVVAGRGAVGKFGLDRGGAVLCHFFSEPERTGQIHARDLARGAVRRLTSVNEDVLEPLDPGDLEEVWIPSGGRRKLQGWILKPPGFNPRIKYPSILEIHGGPRTQYGNVFFHEFRFLAAAGYVVHYTNPRGGQGYGEAHSKSIVNNWGTVDYEDLMTWTDFVARRPYIDRKRMGVTGGSYGGYMTNWIIGHTNRFRAAVTQRCVSNLISMYGSSDVNWAFQKEFGNRPPWESMSNYWRQSPIKHIGNARTPTLVIHSEMDLRCAIEQGEQVFVALKKLGVETEMVRFPEEPHGLSRGGRTDRRVARLKHILRWFDRHLK